MRNSPSLPGDVISMGIVPPHDPPEGQDVTGTLKKCSKLAMIMARRSPPRPGAASRAAPAPAPAPARTSITGPTNPLG
jgi:hypothetical protein